MTRPALWAGALATVALVTLSTLAITGVVLSRVQEFPGERGGTLRVASVGGVGDLDPATAQDAFSVSILRATSRTPYAYGPDGGMVDDLALGPAQISDDSRRLEITLREGVRFAPPVDREVTSADVAYAIERGFLPSVTSSAAKLYFGDLVGLEAFRAGRADSILGLQTPDEHTLVIELEAPTARAAALALTLPIAVPVPREYAARFDREGGEDYADHQVATGPYRIEPTKPDAGDGPILSLTRNPSWEPDTDFRPAFADRIEVVAEPDVATATQSVLDGRDLVSGDFLAPGPALRRALRLQPDQVRLTDSGTIRYFSLNTTSAPLDDVDVRRAITAALDRTAAQRLLGGPQAGTIPTHWIPPGVPGFEEAGGAAGFGLDFLARPDGDLGLARSYMKAAGYRSGSYRGRARLTAVGTDDGSDAELGAALKRTMASLGIPLRVELVAGARVYARCTTRKLTPDICLDGSWVKEFDDAQTILDPLFAGNRITPTDNVNWSLLDDDAVNEAIGDATITTGPGDRAQAWADADRVVTDAAPALPLLWDRFPLLNSADVLGAADEQLGHWDLSFTSLR